MFFNYKTVFNNYTISFSDKLAEKAFSLYKKIRLKLAKLFPLSEKEQFQLNHDLNEEKHSHPMPNGFNYINNQETDGYIKLEYIDMYDFLPKEHIKNFKKEIKRFIIKNEPLPLSPLSSKKELDKRIDNIGYYIDGNAFSNLCTIKLCKNDYLKKNIYSVSISIRNLSTTIALVKYRFYIGNDFNSTIERILKKDYLGCSSVYRSFNIHWYNVRRFGRTHYNGDYARQKVIYETISDLKWNLLIELRKTFTIHFENNKLFPPSFEAFKTNIRFIEEDANKEFWNSLFFNKLVDYSLKYHSSIYWIDNHGPYEGSHLTAFCGGKQKEDDYLQDCIIHDISDMFSTYLVANSLLYLSRRDIAICNKKINNAIKKHGTSNLLKIRVRVEQTLYYSYRFLNEFLGYTINKDEVSAFENRNYENGSIASVCFDGIKERITESKTQIDNILELLNNAAEYRSSKSNISLQWIMMFITVLSLIIAVLSINNETLFDFIRYLFDLLSNH